MTGTLTDPARNSSKMHKFNGNLLKKGLTYTTGGPQMTILPSSLKRNQESDPFKLEIQVLKSAFCRSEVPRGQKCLGKKFPFCRVRGKKIIKRETVIKKGEDIHYGAGKINSCACKHAHRLTSCLVRLMEYDSFKRFSRLHRKGLVWIQSGKKPHTWIKINK